MAKKKASAKKASVKKPAKKAAPKKSSPKVKPKAKKATKAPAKKTVKKPVKKAAAVKKTVKKSAVKKAAPKKATKKPAVKAKASKAVKTAKPAAVKKTPALTSHLVREAKPVKVVDLSDFVTPLDDRLIVQVSAAERMTAGGLYIPDTVADNSGNLQGVVVSVGRGHVSKKGHLRPMDVKAGDSVVFAQHAGTKINLQNEDLIILRESDVMGVISK